MRAVVQRVTAASVTVNGEVVGTIGRGLLAFVGVARTDGPGEADWLAEKLVALRIFENGEGKFAASVEDIGGEILVVSQFTLYADVRRGRRPSFTAAAEPERAEALYERVMQRVRERRIPVRSGRFGARMRVSLDNDGPVTLIVESPTGGTGGGAT
jgi:D-tyrosyl-tRNA(Tyr) deacylase